MKKISLVLLSFIFIFTVAGCGKTQVGIVDQGKIMKNSEHMKRIGEEFRKKATDLQEEEYKARQMIKDEISKQKKNQEIRSKWEKLQSETQQKVFTELKAAVQTIAKEKGLDIVAENMVIYTTGTDITDEVVKRLDVNIQSQFQSKVKPKEVLPEGKKEEI